jgi:hypothetical protein
MIDRLFKNIADRLNIIQELRWIDLEYGQLEIPEDSYPVQFPCALIDFPEMSFDNEGNLNQQAMVAIQVRIGIDLYEDFHIVDGQAAIDRETALQRLQIVNKVYTALHGYEEDYFTPLIRTSLGTERRDDGIKVFVIVFQCAAKDDTAARSVQMRSPVTMNLKKG